MLAIPKIYSGLAPSTTLHIGSSANLTCMANGDPSPQYRWYKSGRLITDNGALTNGNQTLLLTKVTLNDDGIYQCEAYNVEGSDTSTTKLIVYGR